MTHLRIGRYYGLKSTCSKRFGFKLTRLTRNKGAGLLSPVNHRRDTLASRSSVFVIHCPVTRDVSVKQKKKHMESSLSVVGRCYLLGETRKWVEIGGSPSWEMTRPFVSVFGTRRNHESGFNLYPHQWSPAVFLEISLPEDFNSNHYHVDPLFF